MAIEDDLRAEAKASYEKHLAERLALVRALAINSGPNSKPQKELDGKYEIANGEFLAAKRELHGRPPYVRFESMLLFWVPAGIVLIVEAFINKIIVDMAAGTPGAVSLVISFLGSALLVFFAHQAGVYWRQVWSDLEKRIIPSSLIWGIALVGLILVVIVHVMALRAFYALEDSSGTLSIFQQVKAVLFSSYYISKAFSVPEALVIGGLNFLALTFAFLFAFLSHDSDKQYDHLYTEMKDKRRDRADAIATYESEQDKIHKQFKKRIARSLSMFSANKGQLKDLEADDFSAQRRQAERAAPPETDDSLPPPDEKLPQDGPKVEPPSGRIPIKPPMPPFPKPQPTPVAGSVNPWKPGTL